jgi:hypothetical protein
VSPVEIMTSSTSCLPASHLIARWRGHFHHQSEAHRRGRRTCASPRHPSTTLGSWSQFRGGAHVCSDGAEDERGEGTASPFAGRPRHAMLERCTVCPARRSVHSCGRVVVMDSSTTSPKHRVPERIDPLKEPPGIVAHHLKKYDFSRPQLSGTVIDVACGVGYGTDFLGSACERVIAIATARTTCGSCKAMLSVSPSPTRVPTQLRASKGSNTSLTLRHTWPRSLAS